MSTDPVQIALRALELLLLLGGTALLVWLLASARERQRWLSTNALPHWGVTLPEFGLLTLMVMAGGFAGQILTQIVFASVIAKATEQAGLQIFLYGAGLQGGMLAGWLLFPRAREFLYSDYGTAPAPLHRPGLRPSPITDVRAGVATLLVALPVLTAVSLLWVELLRSLGLPDAPQDLIAIFAKTQSPFVIIGMLLVACVLAPLAEEMFFRAGLYRFTRQKLGRAPALLINAVCFGALHASWGAFLPLAALGVIFALAYEATGSIRVPILAHCLFNLNTIVIVLAGLQDAAP